MTPLARKLLELSDKGQARLAYGVMSDATDVFIEGASTAVEVPVLDSVGPLAADDYVALLVSGADALVIGRIGSGGFESGVTTDDADGSGIIAVDFTFPFASAPVVTATRETTSTSAVSVQIYDVTATRVRFRCFVGTTLQAGVSNITINWHARLT